MRSREVGSDEQSALQKNTAVFLRGQMERAYFQLPAFLEEKGTGGNLAETMENCMWREFPLYHYASFIEEEQPLREDMETARRILQNEGVDEDYKNIEEEKLDYEENALHIEGSVLDEMERENGLHNSNAEAMEELPGQIQQSTDDMTDGETDYQPAGFETLDYPSYTYDWSEEWNYEALVSNFYAIDSSTLLKEEYLNLDKLLYQDLAFYFRNVF